MRLFLIRHGETVDNVKGVYAGTLDSALTNFGVEQANRLGEYFAQNEITFSHIFASPLSRASDTAGAVRNAQPNVQVPSLERGLETVKAEELVERDYGSYEGRPYASRSQWMKTGNDGTEETSGGVENAVSLAKRCDRFLDAYLLPVFEQGGSEEFVVAVVAHGMLLSHLWRRLLLRMPSESLSIDPEIIAARGTIVPEHLGGWSNTGYLELSMTKTLQPETVGSPDNLALNPDSEDVATLPTPVPPPLQTEGADISVSPPRRAEPAITSKSTRQMLTGWSTTIVAIDSRKHLLGLKRQRGGIGSSAHDQGQKKVDSFFKPLKLA